MSTSLIQTAPVTLPRFGRPSVCPVIPAAVYNARLGQTVERMRAGNLQTLLIYADREHSANLAYLTGFDPRFEEALLLLSADGRSKLLVGNECLGYLPDTASLRLEVELFQDFSLLGQARANSRPLRTILREFGIGAQARTGCAGWKFFDGRLIEGGPQALDVPAYLADTVRDLAGDARRVVNATGIFMDVDEGLRVTNEPVQIAQFEYASCTTSDGILSVLRHLREGITEQALEKFMDTRGLPLSCHRMVSFGEKARRGLASPGSGRAHAGEAYTAGFGVQGALTCRAGMIARNSKELAATVRDFYQRFVANYFQMVATWYEHIGVGASAGAVVQAVEVMRDPKLYSLAVNPGHYLHLDEWLHSPFVPNSPVRLRSGMMLQMDIIPVSVGPFCCANAEDGVVLADVTLQAQLAREFPALWKRMIARREFMRTSLGIKLDDSVLPLSNIPGWFPPYALDLNNVLVRE